jgi:hypothetical protein
MQIESLWRWCSSVQIYCYQQPIAPRLPIYVSPLDCSQVQVNVMYFDWSTSFWLRASYTPFAPAQCLQAVKWLCLSAEQLQNYCRILQFKSMTFNQCSWKCCVVFFKDLPSDRCCLMYLSMPPSVILLSTLDLLYLLMTFQFLAPQALHFFRLTLMPLVLRSVWHLTLATLEFTRKTNVTNYNYKPYDKSKTRSDSVKIWQYPAF